MSQDVKAKAAKAAEIYWSKTNYLAVTAETAWKEGYLQGHSAAANEGAEMREAFEVTHRKFNALVKAMIKDGLLPEIQIDECCRILEANNKLLFNVEICRK